MVDPKEGVLKPIREDLLRAALAADRAGALKVAEQAFADESISPKQFYIEVLGQLLIDIGESWQKGQLSIWEEHQISNIIRGVIEALYPQVRQLSEVSSPVRTVVLACPPEEHHDLWLRMLADLFELSGWSVVFIGADTPTTEIAAAANAHSPALLILGISTHYHLISFRAVLAELAVTCPNATRIIVTGAGLKGSEESDVLGAADTLGPANLDDFLRGEDA